jgi:hypothetical protein
MAYNNFPNGINNNRRMVNQMSPDNYEYEVQKLMEQERRLNAIQVDFIEKNLFKNLLNF